MAGPRPVFAIPLPNQTPVVVDMTNGTEDWSIGITPGSGTNTIKVEVSFTPNAANTPGQANWFPFVGTGFTAGVTAAGVATYTSAVLSCQALRFTRTVAGSGVDAVEINS